MAEKEQGRINLIIDGISKLYKVNPKFSWFLIIISMLGAISNSTSRGGSGSSSGANPAPFQASSGTEFLTFAILFSLIFVLIVIISVFVQGMISYITYSAIKGETPPITEAFNKTKEKFWVLLEMYIRIALKVLGGLILLIVPGIRAICRYTMAPLVVFDKDVTAKEAVDFSKKQTKNNLLVLFLLLVASTIIMPISAFIQYGGQVSIYPALKKKMKATA